MILEAFVNSAALKTNRRLFVAHKASTSTHATVFFLFSLDPEVDLNPFCSKSTYSYVVWAACLKSSLKIGSQDIGNITLNFLGD